MSNTAEKAVPSSPDLHRELSRALRKCTPAQRIWLRAIPEHKFQPWGTATALKISSHTVQKWLRDPNVKLVRNLQDELMIEELAITPGRVLREYARIAFADPRKLYDENGDLKKPSEWDDDTAAAVSGVDIQEHTYKDGKSDSETTTTNRKARMHDKKSALEVLKNYRGLAPTRFEVTGKDGAPLTPSGTVVNVIISDGDEPPAAPPPG